MLRILLPEYVSNEEGLKNIKSKRGLRDKNSKSFVYIIGIETLKNLSLIEHNEGKYRRREQRETYLKILCPWVAELVMGRNYEGQQRIASCGEQFLATF